MLFISIAIFVQFSNCSIGNYQNAYQLNNECDAIQMRNRINKIINTSNICSNKLFIIIVMIIMSHESKYF